jgi:MHS family proline/betaine transporter-like MFS transporter
MSQGALLPSAALAIASSVLTPPQFISYGWRSLFVAGAVIALVGLWVRVRLMESPAFSKTKATGRQVKVPISEVFLKYPKRLLLGIGVDVGATMSSYLITTFAVTYLIAFIKVPVATASSVIVVGNLVFLVLNPIFGYLSDKVGRRTLMITEWVLALAFVYPFFLLISTGIFMYMLLAFVVYFAIEAIGSPSIISVISEIFPTNVRYTGVSLSYQLSVTIFGGTLPLIATYLVATGYNFGPVYWVGAGIATSLIASLIAKETRGAILET